MWCDCQHYASYSLTGQMTAFNVGQSNPKEVVHTCAHPAPQQTGAQERRPHNAIRLSQ